MPCSSGMHPRLPIKYARSWSHPRRTSPALPTARNWWNFTWASLLRDVAFTDYASNPTAAQAAAELDTMPTYAGPRNGSGHVTPDLLFRGPYPGETVGPYMSQLHLIPTYFGTQPISQQLVTYLANVDYMNDATTYQQVQNGINTGLQNQIDPQPRYLHNGRDLGAYTHLDVLFQAYFTAFLVLNTIGAPRNPGNPYVGSTKQNGFGTFGGPDVAASLTAVARLALNACGIKNGRSTSGTVLSRAVRLCDNF